MPNENEQQQPTVEQPTTPTTESTAEPAKTEALIGEEKQGGEEKKTEEAPKAPEAITAEAIKLPEGFEVDAPVMDEFLGIMNNRDLTPAQQAQALVELQSKTVQAASEKVSALWEAKQTEWQDEVRADTEVGGAKLEGVLGGISTLLNTHGTPELRQVFSETGAGNNIHMVKFMHKIAGLLNEPSPAPGSVPEGGPASVAHRLFPNLK